MQEEHTRVNDRVMSSHDHSYLPNFVPFMELYPGEPSKTPESTRSQWMSNVLVEYPSGRMERPFPCFFLPWVGILGTGVFATCPPWLSPILN